MAGVRELQRAAKEHPDCHIIILNPGYMIGPMDAKPSSGKMLLMGYRRRLMVAPSGGKAFVDVRDVARAAVNALTMGRNGERYIITNRCEEHTISELYHLQAEAMGYRQWVVQLPDLLLRVAGLVGDGLRALGARSQLCTNNIEQLLVREHFDNSRALRELALPQTPLVQSIRDFHQWQEHYKRNNSDR